MKKMKKIIIGFLITVMILSSCQKADKMQPIVIDQTLDEKVEIVGVDEGKKKVDDNEKVSEKEEPKKDNDPVESGWSFELVDIKTSLPYEMPDFKVVPQPKDLKEQYKSIVNRDQITGFTKKQLSMLENQGFVVMQPAENWPDKKMHTSYEGAAYMDLPTFITSDAILNMYHLFYSESMKQFESTDYYNHMVELSNRMLQQVASKYSEASPNIAEDLKYVYAYIAIGNYLFTEDSAFNGIVLPEEVKLIVDYELDNIEKGSNDQGNIMPSILYNKDIDYSQYKVRGHYVLAGVLGTYFKGMMWFSQTGFQLSEGIGEDMIINDEQVFRSLMLTHLIFEDLENAQDWSRVYQLTSLYSGDSDDITPFELRDLIFSVYGEKRDFAAYSNESYKEKLYEHIKGLRKPEINMNIDDNSSLDMSEGLQLRLMGQRYSLDANIMQELMEPFLRPYPTTFDVLTAFGHPVAEEILYEYYPTNQNWPDYDKNLEKMKSLKKSYDGWQDNLYNGWLWAIDAAGTSFEEEENYPELVTSRAWSYKNLSTALGSYAELKHDNILYSKQPMAEAGGPDAAAVHHYVEPNVELYSRLLWLIQYTKLNLESVGSIEDSMIQPLIYMEESLNTLLVVSIKELQGESVTDEEFIELKGIGGLIDYISIYFANTNTEMYIDPVDTSVLIADIATVKDSYVEVAIGMPREIYAVCYVNGKSFLARGSVYSSYEFISGSRLTDDEWATKIGLEKVNIDDTDYVTTEYVGTDFDQLELMPWMATYISNEPNNVEIQGIEVNWLGE